MDASSKILLIGSTGKLGTKIRESGFYRDIICPKKEDLDITNINSITSSLENIRPRFIINCAAIARRKICQANPSKAILVNTIGTANLCQALINLKSKNERNIRLLHISSDAVYSELGGYYNEKDPTEPHCVYGWTKLASECSIRLLADYLIVRTRFFSKSELRFKNAADDIFTSAIEIEKLVQILFKLLMSKYVGVVNVGDKRMSDFKRFSEFNKSLEITNKQNIEMESGLKFSNDYSMNNELLKSIIDN